MMSLPLSLIGALLALLVARSTLNILSIIGFVMLVGLVTKNAILLVDFANQLRASGQDRAHAMLEAGCIRLRQNPSVRPGKAPPRRPGTRGALSM